MTNLLGAETDGLAVDFTDPSPLVQVRTSGVDVFSAPNSFFTYTGAATKYVRNTATTLAALSFPISYGEGLLVEPAAINICLNSQGTTALWDNGGALQGLSSFTGSTVVAPDTTTTGNTMVADASSGIHQVYNQHDLGFSGTDITSGQNYTFSCFWKAGAGAQFIYMNFGNGTDNFGVIFDLVNGITGEFVQGSTSGTYVSSSITSIGNGWYRCSITGSIARVVVYPAMGYATALTGNTYNVNNNVVSSGISGQTLNWWGAQVESGTVATSYIPTTSLNVTRATDATSVALSAFPFSATTGTFVGWFTPRITTPAGIPVIVNINNGTINEAWALCQVIGTTLMGIYCLDGGVQQVNELVTNTGTATLSGNKLAGTFAANDIAVLADGGTQVIDSTCTLPTVTSLNLGYASDTAGRELNGFIRRVFYVPRRMTQAEMQVQTTTGFTNPVSISVPTYAFTRGSMIGY